MERNLLLSPGPTQVSSDICQSLSWPLIHHRTPQFKESLSLAIEGLKYVFQTANDIFLMASSGTGGMDAAVANVVSPKDKVIVIDGGKFGERWSEICLAYHADPKVIKVKWGNAVDPKQIKELLYADKEIKAVFATFNETSTGVVSDIKAIAEIVQETDAILVVDAISGLGIVDIKTDAWGVDVVVGASHKGFMLPPGLSFISVSDKAYKLIKQSSSPKFYFDLRKAKKVIDIPDTPFTPTISLIRALNISFNKFKTIGLENMFLSFERLARATREAVEAIGLTIFTNKSCLSNALTVVNMPEGIDSNDVVAIMRDKYGVTIAGGQAEIKGKVIRIGHMGCIDEYDILAGISCLEKVLKELGYKFILGDGVKAAQRVFNS